MTVRFYFDYLSPYAYLAFHRIDALAAKHGHDVELVPILLAALLNHHGQKGPAEIPDKRVYVFKDCLRTAVKLGLPLRPPPTHPFNPLLALRITSAVQDPATRRQVAARFFDATWATGEGVTDPEVVGRMLSELGLDPAALFEAATSPEGKERVKTQTAEAVYAHVFGVPTMTVDGELFWGFDAFAHLDEFLAGDAPDLAPALERWQMLPSSARR